MTSTLSAQVTGPVLAPYDEGYADEVAAWNTAATHTPELVVGATSAADVAAAVRYAGDHGLHVNVQGTGHGAEVPITSGLMITTRRLDGLTVDPADPHRDHRRRASAGERWSRRRPSTGCCRSRAPRPTVGVIGLLTGGGLGPLARSHGYASDYVESFTVVTGAGEIVEASHTDHADLFWALRGGKFGLGVVTEVRVRLVELTGLYGGSLMFDAADIEPALRAWVDYTATRRRPGVHQRRDHPDARRSSRFPSRCGARTLLSLRFAYPGDGRPGRAPGARRCGRPRRSTSTRWASCRPARSPGSTTTRPSRARARSTALLLDPIDQDFATAFLAAFGPTAESPFVVGRATPPRWRGRA